MAHVLVIAPDADVQCVLEEALRDNGHVVISTPDTALALAVLWAAERPLVVLLDADVTPLPGMELIALASDDETGRLLRHGYILMTTTPQRVEAAQRALLRSMAVPLFPLPFDLDDLYAIVAEATAQVQAQQIKVATAGESLAGPTAARMQAYLDPKTLAALSHGPAVESIGALIGAVARREGRS